MLELNALLIEIHNNKFKSIMLNNMQLVLKFQFNQIIQFMLLKSSKTLEINIISQLHS